MATIASNPAYTAYMNGRLSTAPATASGGGTNWGQAIGNFAASPTGAAVISGVGNYAAAKGQEKQAELDRQLRQQQLQQDARLTVARDLAARQAAGTDRPIGESQNFANRQMLAAAVAKGLFSGGGQIAAPSGIPSQFKPLPIDPAFGRSMTDPTQVQAATANSIAQREADLLLSNPLLAQTSTQALGLGAPSVDPRQQSLAHGQQLWNQQNALWEDQLQAQKTQDMVNQTGKKINPKTGLPKGYELDANGNLKKESFWKTKWGKAIRYGALGAATIATMGASSPAMAAAIAASSGAFQGATSGGGVKGALLGAAMGGVTGGIGSGAAGGVAKAGVGAFSKQAALAGTKALLKDPRFYAGAAPQIYGIGKG